MRLIILVILMTATALFAGRKTDKFFKKANKVISKLENSQKTLIFNQLEEIDNQGGDYLGYSSFITEYLTKWHEIKSSREYRYNYYRNSRNRPRIDAVDLFSGGIAIRESLQLDTINDNQNKEVKDNDKVLLSTLTGPEIKSHPFKEMLGNQEYKLSKLSKLAPNDFYYVHITSFTKALNLWDDLMLKLKPLYKRFQTATIDYKIKDKVMLQLALKENKALRSFYDLVVEEAAIVGSDPFIVTGSDVTIIFNVKNSILFKTTIEKYRKEIKKEENAQIKSIKINNYKVSYLFTNNRKVNSYYVQLDEKHFILSNSDEALKKVINTYKNPNESLFETDEYRYMRSIYKLEKDEGIFLYLSDPFIRRLVGPEVRLKEAQRITTQFRLTKMQNLMLLYYSLYKKAPKSLQDMITELAPKKDPQKHYEYFMNFSKDLKLSKDKTKITSTLYGDLGYFRPNIDNTKFKYISIDEKNTYNNFLRNYNNYWRDYFDPIGIKISTNDKKIVIDTHILPLINSSMYNEVKKFIGGKGIQLKYNKLPSEWLKISFKITDEVKKYLPKFYEEFNREMHLTNSEYIDFFRMIGDNITFSIMDSSPLVDFNINGLFSDMFTRRSRGMGTIALFLTSLAHPIRVTLALKNDINILKQKVDSAITELSKYEENRELSWTFYKKSYKNQEYTVFTLKFWNMVTFRIYFTFTKDALEVTTSEKYLEKIIDSLNSETKTTDNLKNRNISMAFHPNSINLEKEYFSNMLIDNLIKNNLKNIRSLSVIKSIYNKLLTRDEFYNVFGFNINSPLNQEYKDGKTITHPILSGYENKKINMKIINEDILSKYYLIKNASVEFEFTDTGIDTRITIE